MAGTQQRLIEVLAASGFAPRSEPIEMNEEAIRWLIAELEPLAARDVTCVMVGDEAGTFTQEFTGLGGFLDAWIDWLATFEKLELVTGELVINCPHVVAAGSQRGISATAGIAVNADAAAVWTVRDEKLVRVEFHLYRETALRAAGLDPGG